jgi:hypothetical protein
MACHKIDMIDADIHPSYNIEKWLKSSPVDWAQVIGVRAALRVLPITLQFEMDWMKKYSLSLMRAYLIAWAAGNYSTHNMSSAAFHSFRHGSSKVLPNTSILKFANEPSIASIAGLRAAPVEAARAAIAAVDSMRAAKNIDHIGDAAYSSAKRSLQAADIVGSKAEFLSQIILDCRWLEAHKDPVNASRRLTRKHLYHDKQRVEDNILEWQTLNKNLLQIDPNYSVWIDWYERRIRGERAAFDIPGDKGRVEDKKILRRLAEASDEDFWGKGHEYVNATLKRWLEEARVRLAPFQQPNLFTEPKTPIIPTQNRNAISFRTNEEGRIAIDATALAEQLRTDAGARDRHAEAVAEAKAVFDRCQRSNAGARLTRLFENYLDTAGGTLEDLKPSLCVQRGERLRQELAAYGNPDSFLDPVADDLLLDMKGWQTAHNMMVGLDPVLMAMDTAMLGPDRRPLLIAPDEIREKLHEANDAGLLAQGVIAVLDEAIQLAPLVPDPLNRRTIWTTEMFRNLVIEAAGTVLNNKFAASATLSAVVLSGGSLIAGGVTFSTAMGAVKAAELLVVHRAWLEERLGDNQAWRELFQHVADWLETITPFRRQ